MKTISCFVISSKISKLFQNLLIDNDMKTISIFLLSDHTVVTNKNVGKQCLIIAGKNANWREN